MPDEAKQVADEFRRSRPELSDLVMMAENFEKAGDLEQAYRWVLMGVNRLDVDDASEATEGFATEYLLSARQRIRSALGFPPDELDEVAEANRARHRSRR